LRSGEREGLRDLLGECVLGDRDRGYRLGDDMGEVILLLDAERECEEECG